MPPLPGSNNADTSCGLGPAAATPCDPPPPPPPPPAAAAAAAAAAETRNGVSVLQQAATAAVDAFSTVGASPLLACISGTVEEAAASKRADSKDAPATVAGAPCASRRAGSESTVA